jgi:hypothetical protein
MHKGAYKYDGGKQMSGSRTGMSGKGRMSSSHGTNGQSKDNNMSRKTGGHCLSKGEGFGHSEYERGPDPIGKGRKHQVAHKDKA